MVVLTIEWQIKNDKTGLDIIHAESYLGYTFFAILLQSLQVTKYMQLIFLFLPANHTVHTGN